MSSHTDPLEGWPHDEPAFHSGEQAVQERFGLRERLAEVGTHIMRGAMPDQHRELFERLPYLVLGALDDDGRPWASIVAGPPGFIRTPDARTLHVAAELSVDDPAAGGLSEGAAIGLLGIELATRRRNRANGHVVAAGADGLTVRIEQSFGNCPKYIHPRTLVAAPRAAGPASRLGARLSAPAAALVERADTFFIASASADAGPRQSANGGVDVSHRGGPAGFVRLGERDGHSVLTIPDYVGNFLFNTLGNVEVNPRVGVIFPDFESGDVLQLTGRAEIVWDGAEVAKIAGAQRLMKIAVDEGWWRPAALGLIARP